MKITSYNQPAAAGSAPFSEPWSFERNQVYSEEGADDIIQSAYVRWLGNRKGIEEKTKTWDKVIVDRQSDLFEWVSLLKKVHERRIMILAFQITTTREMDLRRSSCSAAFGVTDCRNR